jgi:pimeloyl-ACP methyl ester carboxylesterase
VSQTDPPLVVLLHGTRDTAPSFEAVSGLLDELDVVAYDRRGWGQNPAEGPASLAEHADDLLAVIGHRPATVIGHSFGGHVAITTAIRRPDLVLSVGIWESTMPWAPWWRGDHGRLIRAARDNVAGKTPGSPQQNRDRQGFVFEATESLSQHYDLTQFTTPCIVGYGEANIPSFQLGTEALADEIGAELFALPGAAHMAHRDDPAGFARFIRRAVALGQRAGKVHR